MAANGLLIHSLEKREEYVAKLFNLETLPASLELHAPLTNATCYLEELPFPVFPQTSAHPGCSGERNKVCCRQSSRVPVLPGKVDPFWMCLSPEDIRELSPDSCARQVPSLSHIIVEGRDMMYKLVYFTSDAIL